MFSALNNDQIIFATAGYDHVIRFWKPNTGQCYRCLEHKESVYKSILILDFFFFIIFSSFQSKLIVWQSIQTNPYLQPEVYIMHWVHF